MIDFFRVVPKKRTVKLHKKSGVLFYNPKKIWHLAFYVGCLLFFAGIFYAGYLYQPLVLALVNYSKIDSKVSQVVNPAPLPDPVITDLGFEVSIPKIGAKGKITKNVLTQSEDEYMKVLRNGNIAHAQGSDLPGDGPGKMIYLFAHSTEQDLSIVRRNSVFYLLDYMKSGDEIFLQNDGNSYKYQVFDKKIVSATESKYLSYSDPSSEVVILQTCWPLGTNWKRLMVFAKRV